jgi:putative membrane protein
MKIVRTVVWVLLLVALLIFSGFNWKPVEVKIWEGLLVETKIPALVVIAFLIGLVPMWLVHRASRWNYDRRIASLESAARASVTAPAAPPSTATAPDPAPAAEPGPLTTEPEPVAGAPRSNFSPPEETKPTP